MDDGHGSHLLPPASRRGPRCSPERVGVDGHTECLTDLRHGAGIIPEGSPLTLPLEPRWLRLLLLLLLLTPNKILKKTENRVLLSVSEWGPSTEGKDQKKRKLKRKKLTML